MDKFINLTSDDVKENIRNIDLMLNLFGINAELIDEYIIVGEKETDEPYIYKYDEKLGFVYVCKGKQTVSVVESLFNLRKNFNSSLDNEISRKRKIESML